MSSHAYAEFTGILFRLLNIVPNWINTFGENDNPVNRLYLESLFAVIKYDKNTR